MGSSDSNLRHLPANNINAHPDLDLIVIPSNITSLLLKQDNSSDLISLYNLYCYIQKFDNKYVGSELGYITRKLKFSSKRARNVRGVLKSLGLIVESNGKPL